MYMASYTTNPPIQQTLPCHTSLFPLYLLVIAKFSLRELEIYFFKCDHQFFLRRRYYITLNSALLSLLPISNSNSGFLTNTPIFIISYQEIVSITILKRHHPFHHLQCFPLPRRHYIIPRRHPFLL